MAEYYKYAERSADAEVNWYEIGKNLTDTLAEANRIREEKKEAYNQQTRDNLNALANAPQGQDQDANNFTNQYVDMMTKQIQMDEKLFKSGKMKESQYRLRRQNYTDGTNQLFDLQKLYQEEAKKTQEGIDAGLIQSNLAISNMASVEGRANFNNSAATIDSMGDGKVGVSLYENKVIDGKVVKVLSTNTVPVAVMRSKILHKPPMWQVDKSTTDLVDGLGTLKDAIYEAADFNNAGTITELVGMEAVKLDPRNAQVVIDLNRALDDKIGAFFTDPYKLTTILGEKTGKYDAKSYIFDKDEAAKDPTKILMKIDPITQAPTIDREGPHFKEQEKEATEWVKRDIIMKMDRERSVKTTPQNQLQESADAREKAAAKYRPKDATQEKLEMDAKNFAENASNFLYGTTDEIKDAGLKYMVSHGAVIQVNPPGKPTGNYIMNPNGDYVPFQTTGDPVKGGKAAIGALLVATGMTNLPEDLVVKNMKWGKYNTTASGTGVAANRDYKNEIVAKLEADKETINSDLFNDQDSVDTGRKLAEYFKDVDGIVVKPNTTLGFNDITLTYTPKNAKLKPVTVKLNANERDATSKTQFINFTKFINSLPDDVKDQFLGPETVTTGGTVQEGVVR